MLHRAAFRTPAKVLASLRALNDLGVMDALLVRGQVLLPGEKRGADVALEVLDL